MKPLTNSAGHTPGETRAPSCPDPGPGTTVQPPPGDEPPSVTRLRQIGAEPLRSLLSRYGLRLEEVPPDRPIPGSYWGDEEAGLRGDTLLARDDTPVHSVLHEACHWVCMPPDRRAGLDTDAGGDYEEENGVCYLQVLLADRLEGYGRRRMMRDMDAWGYSFRLGSTRAWFEQDAEDARAFLAGHGLTDRDDRPTWKRRER